MKKTTTPQVRYADEEVVAVKCYRGPHRAKLITRDTGKFIQWLSMDHYRRIKIIELKEKHNGH